MKKITFFLLLFPLAGFAQTIKSPAEFLGYQPGERFTPHYAVVNYFNYIQRERPNNVKLNNYGKTNEGRELLYATVSDRSNISNLEEVRLNNLRLTGMVNDKPGNPAMPAVVWLSFNVHGNEASSTEVAMQILYELSSGNNHKANGWLKNTVVIIDPSLNPDGRDRYVNWFNGVVGRKPNPLIYAREHVEPWPGGRSNHYYFDLNRDWVWQTQTESKQRLAAYHQWMPAVHVDFHEQYYNSPYFFPPAAEPVHDVVTSFQRAFQTVMGKNHARYFDEQGWLYFTRQYFDLFYPSYGDTYPLYNGAVGMTYEQAGHSMGGLTVAFDGDTLTLAERIQHHFTTGMSTIEVASVHHDELNRAFQGFFQQTLKQGSGIYKTYILESSNEQKLKGLMALLDKNNIQYGVAGKEIAVKGFHYFSGKTENYRTKPGDLIVSTLQPQGVLARTLFEPNTRLSDSLTYDITAWALPYVYGIDAWGVQEVVPSVAPVTTVAKAIPDNAYGYLAVYNSIESGKFLVGLLRDGIKVRVSSTGFSYMGERYNPGTLIILQHGNKGKIQTVFSLASQFGISLKPVTTGMMDSGGDFGSEDILAVNRARIGIMAGDNLNENSVGAIWHFFDEQLDYPISVFSGNDPNKLPLDDLDVIILADGWYDGLDSKDGNDALKGWLRKGGKLVAIDNAAWQMAKSNWGINVKSDNSDNKAPTSKPNLTRYNDKLKESISDFIPGAIYRVNIDNTHPLGYGYPNFYYTLKTGVNIFEHLSSGWNVGTIEKDVLVAGFAGKNVKDKIKDGTVIATHSFGRGTITYFSEDPLFRSFWENGKLFLINAVFLNKN